MVAPVATSLPPPPDRDRRTDRVRAVSAETVAAVHDDLFEAAVSSYALIRAQLRASVSEHLGPEFDVEVDFEPGSVELVATILLVGSVVMTYGAVRSGLDYVRKDAAFLLRRVLDPTTPAPIDVAASVTLGPAMSKFALTEQPSNSSPGGAPTTYLAVMASLVIATLLTTLLVVVFVKVL
jgi:hypothetical protein